MMDDYNPALFISSSLFLPFLKKSPPPEEPEEGDGPACDADELKLYKQRSAVYKKIIDRYSEMIEEKENKTITELKTLVRPENKAILKVRDDLVSEFDSFLYERDFPDAAKNAFSFVKEKISDVYLPLDFWLTPEEIIELKAADDIEKSIFLCSLLIALGNNSSRVGVEVEGRAKRAFVFFSFNNEDWFMDPVKGVIAKGEKKELFEKQLPGYTNKVVYDFNDQEYHEWESNPETG